MVSAQSIKTFFEQPLIAVIGVSRQPLKFSNGVYHILKEKGLNVIPVNPNVSEIDGDICYDNITTLPFEIPAALILTPASRTDDVVKQAIAKGVKHIWIQNRAETQSAIDLALKNGIDIIYKQCILMFAEPVKSIHGFHKFLNRLFGKYPKGF
ncbi:MAG: CoA-binding protein [FCB group bacterium]|jgi:predicted CoA-binding protein